MTEKHEALEALVTYVLAHTDCCPDCPESGGAVVDVHFFRAVTDEAIDPAELTELIERCITLGAGEFAPFDRDRLAGGPSYIELGTWVGDQTLAFLFMAAGQAAKLWEVITPARLGITDEAMAGELAGRGMVMVSGYKPAVEEVQA